jgi:hypothetical protein
MSKLTLREAYDRWRDEPGTPANAYDWYRRQARERGNVWGAAVRKAGRAWVIDAEEFERALEVARRGASAFRPRPSFRDIALSPRRAARGSKNQPKPNGHDKPVSEPAVAAARAPEVFSKGPPARPHKLAWHRDFS